MKSTDENVDGFLTILKNDKPLAYDVETNGLDKINGFVCGYSVSDGVEAFYVPVRHGGGGNIENVEGFEKQVAETIRNRKKPLITHNGKFDSHFSINHGIELGNKLEDTMISSALLDEQARSYSLAAQAAKYKDIPQKKGTDLYYHLAEQFNCKPDGKSMANFWRLSGDDPVGCEYARFDTLTTYHLWQKHSQEIYGQNLDQVYSLENRLIHVLRKMEKRGVKIDMTEIEKVKAEVDEIQLEVYNKIPMNDKLEPLGVRSAKDLTEYFMMHDMSDFEYTAKGNISFKKTFLQQSEPGKLIIQARAIDMLKNTFVGPIETFIKNGQVHCDFNQTPSEFGGAKSGRFSCREPNLQQVPARDGQLGPLFRRIFVANKGYKLYEADWSQCEPRIFSHYANEPVLINGYNQTPFVDMHQIAANLMHIDRKVAKNLNLGLFYGMGVAKLAVQLGVPEETARNMYYSWKRSFPRIAEFTKLASTVAEQRGYVKTVLGRRARFPDPRWAYRAANRVVQGSNADILKFKMVQIDDWIVSENLEDQVKILLTIHDSLVFEIHDDISSIAVKKIKEIMEDVQSAPFNLRVPFVAEIKSGINWSECTYGK